MTTHDTRPGSTGGADVPGPLYGGPDDDYTPEQLAAMNRDDLDRLGARYDGVEILHVDPGPAPGSPMERRALRQVGMVFTLAGVFAFLFVVLTMFGIDESGKLVAQGLIILLAAIFFGLRSAK